VPEDNAKDDSGRRAGDCDIAIAAMSDGCSAI
jgi:hypothetical protein